MKYSKYSSYKDSGVAWLGDMPEHWSIKKFKYLFQIRKRIAGKLGFEVLSITQKGIIVKDIESGTGQLSADYSKYQHVKKGDFAMNHMDLLTGFVDLSKYNGITSPDYRVFKLIEKHSEENYYLYLLQMGYTNKIFYPFGQGSSQLGRWRLPSDEFKEFLAQFPPLEDQRAIANYLEKATDKIDTLISKQRKLIELLKEKRQALISHAVTKGLNPHAKMKQSGVEWLGDVPEHWENYRIDWINSIIRGNTGFKKDELLDNGEYVALQYGKTYKVDEVNETFKFFVNSEFYKFSQVVHRGDTILISTSETIEDLGHSCFYNRNDLGLIGGEQILLKPNAKLVSEKYLYYSSKVFCGELRKYATGLKVFRFNIDDLKKIFISISSVEEQQAIANYLDNKTKKIDNLIEKATKAIVLLKERRTTLISSAVTGKIDVRNMA